MPEKLLNEFEVAAWLGLSVLTLRRTRTVNPDRHPPFKKIGASVRYDRDEVRKWIDSKTVNRLDVPKDKIESPQITNTQTKKEKRSHPGRPSKSEIIRAGKNASK